MEKIQATVCILTFNSGKTLRRALDSVRDFDEFLLCDGCSTDDTLAIAKEYGCRVIEQDTKFKNPDNTLKDIGSLRNQCVDAAGHDWVLILDSDESVSPGLVDEIRQVVASDPATLLYQVPMRMIIGERPIIHSSNYPGYQFRFFDRRSGARFVRPVHNKLEFDRSLAIGTFTHPWNVYWDDADVEQYARRSYKYIADEVNSLSAMSVGGFVLHFLPWHLKVIAAVIVKTTRDRLLYPASSCMPLKVEYGRIRYQLRLIVETGKKFFRKKA